MFTSSTAFGTSTRTAWFALGATHGTRRRRTYRHRKRIHRPLASSPRSPPSRIPARNRDRNRTRHRNRRRSMAPSPLLVNGNLPLRHGGRKTTGKPANSSPKITSRSTPPQPGTSARTCASRTETRPACATATSAPPKTSTRSVPAATTENFRTNPRIPVMIRKMIEVTTNCGKNPAPPRYVYLGKNHPRTNRKPKHRTQRPPKTFQSEIALGYDGFLSTIG
jgi:hypothetical protein